MSESPLEAVRRQIREAEDRLKKSPPVPESAKPPLSEMRDRELSRTAWPSFSPQGDGPVGAPEGMGDLHNHLCKVLGNLGQAVVLVDAKGSWKLANHILAGWLGYTLGEFQQIDLGEIFDPEDVKELIRTLPQWVCGEAPLRQTPLILRGKKGERVPTRLSSHSMSSEAGEQFAYLVFEDMRLVGSLEAQVEVLKGFFVAVMRSGSVPVFLLREDGLITAANRAACRQMGIDRERLLSAHLQDFIVGSGETDFAAVLDRAMSLKFVTGVYRFRREGGAEFWARLFLACMAGARDSASRILATLERPEAAGTASETARGDVADDYGLI
jgi:PAS domain S-box-containing protein